MNIDQTRDPLAQVLQWILDGASEADVKEAIRVHFPKAKGEALIMSVLRDLERDRKPGLILGWCHEASREVYRKAMEIGDLPTALRSIKVIFDLSKRIKAKPEDGQTGLSILDVG